eukprot:20032-Amphidinium_carterae.1
MQGKWAGGLLRIPPPPAPVAAPRRCSRLVPGAAAASPSLLRQAELLAYTTGAPPYLRVYELPITQEGEELVVHVSRRRYLRVLLPESLH